ncbi:MAG: PolC-type DNA polymerase III [Lachnospiraceae bacterium]|nr:PolC-type DNA polymerase III [Agathobacter sp.]MDD6445794.1 PolC-type DNA polymerase III [Lachnospiraceae bacterium]MDY4893311.1 PolC-type DNA polymerase III [Agathobacter sp.]
MGKAFRETFPTLKLDEELEGLLDTAEVTKISTNREHTRVRVYLKAQRLIFKKNIWKLEEMIASQIFQNQEMQVNIIESYELSEQYTPQSLMDVYFDSILDELNAYSVLEYNLLRTADMEFDTPNHMILTMDETIIAKTRTEEILQFLEKVICERCGMDLIIQPMYRKPIESKYRKNSEEQIRQEVAGIVARTKLVLEGKHEPVPEKTEESGARSVTESVAAENKGNSAVKTVDMPKTSGTFGKQKTRFEKKGDFRRKFDAENKKKSMNPDVIYGRDFEEDSMDIEKIDGPIGEVVIRGKILSVDTREIRNEKTIIMFTVTDFTDTIVVKIFARNDDVKELLGEIAPGKFVRVKGMAIIDKFDSDLTIGSIVGIKKCPDFTTVRMDTSAEKRVELHCHTKMSDMDGVSDVKDIVKRAMKWGHKAIAITDHGNVQAFPDANHTVPSDSDFKVIYGCEAYLVDDIKGLVTDSRNQSLDADYVVFDLETTGFSPESCKIIEIGAVKVQKGSIVDKFSTFVNPKVPIPFRIEQLTSINDSMVMDAPVIEDILPEFMKFCEGCVMVAHNADFDMSFIKKNCQLLDIPCNPTIVDTVALARVLLPNLNRFKLDTVAKALGVSLDNHHRAVDDAGCTAEIFVKFIEMLKDRGVTTLDEVNKLGASSVENVQKMPTYHAIILATCDQGRTNLYKLVSLAHIKYYHKRPRIPKSEFIKYRDGLLIGSACEAGELYRAILNGRPEEEISRLVEFYDYLEIQPLGNNAFLVRDEESPIASNEDLIEINKKIVRLGEQFHKPVVATCDVHFLDPEDEIYRRIIMAGQGFKDCDNQAPLFLRTTEEMLKEFEYLGSEKAEEVVITNTNRIADMCEKISPVRPDKCPPVIENSDQMLRDICYNKAHKMYGNPLPEIVQERLDRELNSIISNGYAVMYIIAQKLVWKSNEDGYLVGSRGSVGSSFVATMSGITEVNPLHAHYLCKHCQYSDFDSDLVKSFSGRSGCDMPDKLCPRCGKPLSKEGFDIPFETFLGFKGNKEPDIDLNFSGEYQSKAHKYTEVIFGEGQTFKAGTIGTLADKTAFGYVKNYYEERGVHKRNCEIDRIVTGCVGVRRTTGQHPGGIVVLPMGEQIYTFTPIQHPANDMTVDITTTHFDYHSIDHNLLKLDILGHDDPTMIRMLQDLTGVDPTQIPLDDKAVMSLFQDTQALGITPDDLVNCKLGALGIPEFGTDFAMGMLIDTQPKEFSDLIRIAGLSHGTDVWLGNAQTLIQEKKATISTAICTRDDIMIYLISMGLDSEESFKIMENVRKGIVAKGKCDKWPEWKQDMIDHGVPDWYIWSCEKIKYMFPKAHAAAYVMMAWRIAYCKVFYPLAYYAAYFSIRATSFNYELMCQGKDKLEAYMHDYEARKDSLSKKEQDTYKDMRLVQEMYARGFEFLPLDIYKSKPHHFQIIDGKLLPALNTIDGLGDNAAVAIAEAAKDGVFLSKDDFRERTKVSKTTIELMSDLGLLGDMPESNQLSLFDFGA